MPATEPRRAYLWWKKESRKEATSKPADAWRDRPANGFRTIEGEEMRGKAFSLTTSNVGTIPSSIAKSRSNELDVVTLEQVADGAVTEHVLRVLFELHQHSTAETGRISDVSPSSDNRSACLLWENDGPAISTNANKDGARKIRRWN
jgi:hypothetical protein